MTDVPYMKIGDSQLRSSIEWAIDPYSGELASDLDDSSLAMILREAHKDQDLDVKCAAVMHENSGDAVLKEILELRDNECLEIMLVDKLYYIDKYTAREVLEEGWYSYRSRVTLIYSVFGSFIPSLFLKYGNIKHDSFDVSEMIEEGAIRLLESSDIVNLISQIINLNKISRVSETSNITFPGGGVMPYFVMNELVKELCLRYSNNDCTESEAHSFVDALSRFESEVEDITGYLSQVIYSSICDTPEGDALLIRHKKRGFYQMIQRFGLYSISKLPNKERYLNLLVDEFIFPAIRRTEGNMLTEDASDTDIEMVDLFYGVSHLALESESIVVLVKPYVQALIKNCLRENVDFARTLPGFIAAFLNFMSDDESIALISDLVEELPEDDKRAELLSVLASYIYTKETSIAMTRFMFKILGVRLFSFITTDNAGDRIPLPEELVFEWITEHSKIQDKVPLTNLFEDELFENEEHDYSVEFSHFAIIYMVNSGFDSSYLYGIIRERYVSAVEAIAHYNEISDLLPFEYREKLALIGCEKASSRLHERLVKLVNT